MGTTATCNLEYTLERILYMAIELDNNRWKLVQWQKKDIHPRKCA